MGRVRTLPTARLARLLCLCAALAAPLAAQRPKSAREALDRFEQVRDRAEGERRRAVGDLGPFADDEVTAVLLAELERAAELGYRQTVVRALGQQPRNGAVPALRAAFAAASNPRLADSAAEGLARQGDAGIAALGELLAAQDSGDSKWNSLCNGLGESATPAARDLLLGVLKKAGGRERLGALRNLRRWSGDAAVDEVRLQLARDKDPLVAGTSLQQLADHDHPECPALALELSRRLGTAASSEQRTAVVHGLLLAPSAANLDALLANAALAEDPFAEARLPLWRRALADAAFVRALATAAPGRKASGERALAATALQFTDPAQIEPAVAALLALLGQRDAAVVRAAAASLTALAPSRAAEPLAAIVRSGADPLPAIALEASHALHEGDAAWPAELLQHATGRTPGLCAAALQLLARIDDGDAQAVLAAAAHGLTHKSWNVRAAAITLLVERRLAGGVPLLFERLDAEQARLRADVEAALRELTGLQFPTTAAWREWWAKEGATFTVPARKKPDTNRRDRDAGTAASYWNLPVYSDRIAFVIDVSGSMNQPFGTGDATRLDEAKRQLERVLAALPPKTRANVIAFGNDAQSFAPSLQPIDDRRRKAAGTWTTALAAHGATNVHAALERAFADPDVDTIYLLTDGRPSSGPIVEPTALAREVLRWNAGRGICIHTVALGGRSDFLERLAAESGGQHTVAR